MPAVHVDPRVLQANERTLLAWVRTGVALMAFGFLIDRMALWLRFEVHVDNRLSLLLGTISIIIGGFCELIGAVRFLTMRRALVAGRPYIPGVRGPIALVVVVVLLGSALLLYLMTT